MSSYYINYTDGRADVDCASVSEAEAILIQQYPEMAMGHDGDLSDGGDRTLVWADDASSANDDGANAVASIHQHKE
jgi:hypothetical protein